jgi:hypothetical protein
VTYDCLTVIILHMSAHKHILPPADLSLPQTLHQDKHILEEVDVPVITVSATFRTEIKKYLGEKITVDHEAVFSRAHYSMAVGILAEANRRNLTSWLVDPTNYVSESDWKKVVIIEHIGQMTARIPFLKMMKDFADSLVRSKFPLRQAIESPLRYVVKRCVHPIISMHYEAGNIIATEGKNVISVVTDPYVHVTYLYEAHRPNITFAVFDEATKREFIEKAALTKIKIDESRIVVTGPPVDPRIVAKRKGKKPTTYKRRGLRLVITTSGLGTNKNEIEKVLDNLLPYIKKNKMELILYASTHDDFRQMYYDMAQKHKLELGSITSRSKVRIIHRTDIVQANQELIDYAFGWADGFITKPSGDMAYDAVAAGCFILSLESWGVWENNIEKLFSEKKILKKADVNNFSDQLSKLSRSGWIEEAIGNSLNIDKLFLEGSKKIVDLQRDRALQ